MSQEPKRQPITSAPEALSRQVGVKAARKLKARRSGTPGVWFGLGMMGLVGWSVAVPLGIEREPVDTSGTGGR